jgi:hypothetical protein
VDIVNSKSTLAAITKQLKADESSRSTTNVPLGLEKNIPLAQSRLYVQSKEIQNLAVEKYYKCGKGITFKDLILSGFAQNKEQSP